MKIRVQLSCVSETGAEACRELLAFERTEGAKETLGLALAEGKAPLRGVQESVVAEQVAEDLSGTTADRGSVPREERGIA